MKAEFFLFWKIFLGGGKFFSQWRKFSGGGKILPASPAAEKKHCLYVGGKQKPDIFSLKNSEIFVSVKQKNLDIYFFGENQRFLLALKKWIFIFFERGMDLLSRK